jgi:hypothetical protein
MAGQRGKGRARVEASSGCCGRGARRPPGQSLCRDSVRVSGFFKGLQAGKFPCSSESRNPFFAFIWAGSQSAECDSIGYPVVIPAKAGIQGNRRTHDQVWIPASQPERRGEIGSRIEQVRSQDLWDPCMIILNHT